MNKSRARQYDQQIIDAISKKNLDSVLQIPKQLVEDAKRDSLWQIAILAGALADSRMKPRLYTYEVPTYYDMICASFIPK